MTSTAPSDATVFVVDDDVRLRRTLVAMLESRGIKSETYGTGAEILEAREHLRSGCLLIDVRLPDMSGLELHKQLLAGGVNLPVIIITGYADVPTAVAALKVGAVDFLEKPFKIEALLERVSHALELDRQARQRQATVTEMENRLARLTPREREVLEQVIAGLRSKAIARELGISARTVEFHRARILEKMEAQSISHLVNMVLTSREGRDL
jgi:FixJ family two-component response regulator